VVASFQALEGIKADIGTEVMAARDGVEFIATVSALLQQPHDVMGEAARARVLADYTWEHNLAVVDELLAADAALSHAASALSPTAFATTGETA